MYVALDAPSATPLELTWLNARPPLMCEDAKKKRRALHEKAGARRSTVGNVNDGGPEQICPHSQPPERLPAMVHHSVLYDVLGQPMRASVEYVVTPNSTVYLQAVREAWHIAFVELTQSLQYSEASTTETIAPPGDRPGLFPPAP